MKAGKEVNEWGGSEWEELTPEECKREAGLEDLVKKVCVQSTDMIMSPRRYNLPSVWYFRSTRCYTHNS